MITSFGDKISEHIFHGIESKKTRKIPNEITEIILRKFDYINAAYDVMDLKSPPGNRLERLKGDLKEFYSIRINDQYRIIFKWQNHEAHLVQIVDYH